jgi:putative acetyltransferase
MDALGGLRIERIDAQVPGLPALVADHAAHSAAHYPAESNHHLDLEGLARSGLRLFGGFRGDELVAMGGYLPFAPGEAEVKSMHVRSDARGLGAGRAILDAIITSARSEDIGRLWLETGSRPASEAARRLYLRAGFVETDPFGPYRPDPESVFMKLDLQQRAAVDAGRPLR